MELAKFRLGAGLFRESHVQTDNHATRGERSRRVNRDHQPRAAWRSSDRPAGRASEYDPVTSQLMPTQYTKKKGVVTAFIDRLLVTYFRRVNQQSEWYKLSKWIAVGNLLALRIELREHNLRD